MPDPTNDIDSLIRYLDYLVGCDPQWSHAVRALVAERDAAIKQRDEAQRDAERYRWLKSEGCDWVTIYRHPSGDEIFDGKGDAKMDERIDAARSRDEEGGGA